MVKYSHYIAKEGKNEAGFTLIEIIIVMVILGILSSIVMPKYYDIINRVETEVETNFLGRLKTALHLFSMKRYTDEELTKTYPVVQTPLYERVLAEIPKNWTYDPVDGKIEHLRQDNTTREWYYWINDDSSKFEIRTEAP